MRATRSLAMFGWAFIGIGLGAACSLDATAAFRTQSLTFMTHRASGDANLQELQQDL